MSGRSVALAGLARRALGPHYAIPKRGGGGGPIKLDRPVDHPLPEEDELLWTDGTANPEPCLDAFPLVTPWQAAGGLAAAMSIFAVLGVVVRWRDKPSKSIYAPREYPFDNLKVEMGGEPDDNSLLDTIKSKLPFTS